MNNTKSNVMKTAHKKFNLLKARYLKMSSSDLSLLWAKVLKWAWKVNTVKGKLNLWSDGVQDAIKRGLITLSQGEAVYCGENTQASYYVNHTKNTIHLVHWQGSKEATLNKLNKVLQIVNRVTK